LGAISTPSFGLRFPPISDSSFPPSFWAFPFLEIKFCQECTLASEKRRSYVEGADLKKIRKKEKIK